MSALFQNRVKKIKVFKKVVTVKISKEVVEWTNIYSEWFIRPIMPMIDELANIGQTDVFILTSDEMDPCYIDRETCTSYFIMQVVCELSY